MKIYITKSFIIICSIFLIFQQNTSAKSTKENIYKKQITSQNTNTREGSTRDNYGILNNCGNRATAPVTCNFSPYYQGVKGKNKLSQLCESENFGAIEPGVLFKTRKKYKLREHINIEYEGACPYKTEFVITKANSRLTTARNMGTKRKSIKVPSYRGEMIFENKYIPKRPGNYAIQAYYIDSYKGVRLAGRSLPFKVKD